MTLVIEKGVPLPVKGVGNHGAFRSEITATMAKMEIEDSVFIPNMTMNKMTAKTSEFRRRHQPTWRFTHETQTRDGIKGVCIWRIEDRKEEPAAAE